jgi:hypothetical protein
MQYPEKVLQQVCACHFRNDRLILHRILLRYEVAYMGYLDDPEQSEAGISQAAAGIA